MTTSWTSALVLNTNVLRDSCTLTLTLGHVLDRSHGQEWHPSAHVRVQIEDVNCLVISICNRNQFLGGDCGRASDFENGFCIFTHSYMDGIRLCECNYGYKFRDSLDRKKFATCNVAQNVAKWSKSLPICKSTEVFLVNCLLFMILCVCRDNVSTIGSK